MNVNFQDMAESLKVKPVNQAAPEEEKPQAKTATKDNKVDPTQWWGALTEQFQHIATHAMKDMAPMQVRMPQMQCPKISLLKKLLHLIKAAQVQLVAGDVNHPPRPAHLS
jgi:hypothetical protein